MSTVDGSTTLISTFENPRFLTVGFFPALSELSELLAACMSFQSALLMSLGSSNQALRACIEPAWMSKRQTGAAEVSNMFVHHILKQIATLHGRGKHGEAEQARCHGQRILLDEL